MFGTLMLLTHNLTGQDNNDCINAIVICSDENIDFNPTGPGMPDFNNGNNDDGCLQGEHQSGWYYFQIRPDAPPDLELGFILDPDAGSGQDYDFALFGPDVSCNDLNTPLRCSYAWSSCAFCPQTGLGMGAMDLTESPAGDGFLRTITVQPSEGYYLLIDNFQSSFTGFSLTWTGSAAPWLDCLECNADAGDVLADDEAVCPGSSVDYRATQFYVAENYTNLTLVADANGDIVNVNPNFLGSFSSPQCGVFTVYSYNFNDFGGASVPEVGDNITDLNCGTSCCDLDQVTITFGDAEEPVFADPPPNLTLPCGSPLPPLADLTWTDDCDGTGTVSGQEFTNSTGCNGGSTSRVWSYTDGCGNTGTHTQTITIAPPPAAAFNELPAGYTISCSDLGDLPAPPLTYTNVDAGGCVIAGSVDPVRTDFVNGCGGSIVFSWTFTDACDRTITHEQTITVDPAPQADFVDPPAAMTVGCVNIDPDQAAVLAYTNNETGSCAITGTVTATTSGGYDACGGTLTNSWTFTDACDRMRTHTQVVTVTAAPPPAFANPPGDTTIACGQDFPPAPSLTYTNAEDGLCALTGSVAAVVTGIGPDEVRYDWTFTAPCTGATVSHRRTVVRETEYLAALAEDGTTICAGQPYDLAGLPVTDAAGNTPLLTYHTGSPTTTANELATPIVAPADTTVYFVRAENPFGCATELPFTVRVRTPPSAGTDGGGPVCMELADSVSLWAFLSGGADLGGSWADTEGYGIDLTAPDAVNLTGRVAGLYRLAYIAPAAPPCSSDTATVTLELLPAVAVQFSDLSCSADLNSYAVSFDANGYAITTTGGGTLTNSGEQYVLFGIPVDSTATITAENLTLAGCSSTLAVDPPDCSCPEITPPVAGADAAVCAGDPNPQLLVTAEPGLSANWFALPSGGTPLLSSSLTFTPPVSDPGVYEYYVESVAPVSGCISFPRIPVRFEIIANPIAAAVELTVCDTDQDGRAPFDLSRAGGLLTGADDVAFRYFSTAAAAQSNGDSLPYDFVNTTPLSQTIFVRLENAAGCATIASLGLRVELPVELQPVVRDESCPGSNDGSVTVGGAAGARFSLDSVVWTTDTTFGALPPGNYTVYAENVQGCVAARDFSVASGMAFSINGLTVVCDPSGTLSDPIDDVSTVTFTVSNSLGVAGTYTVRNGSELLGTYAYGTPNGLSFPAAGQLVTLTFTDTERGCTLSRNLPPLVTCSEECAITGQFGGVTCANGGTSDPGDDTFRFTVSASGMNNSVAWRSELLTEFYTYSTEVGFGPYPIAGGDVVLPMFDAADPDCRFDLFVPAPAPCSPVCDIAVTTLNVSCNDAGTISQQNDDFYEVFVNAGGGGGGLPDSFAVAVDGVPLGVFAYGTGGTVMVPTGGDNSELTVSDRDDPGCFTRRTIGPLPPCNDACAIRATVNLITCDDADTGTDPNDDTFSFYLFVTGENTTGEWVAADGSLAGVHGQAFLAGPYPIAAGDLNLVLTDRVNPECRVLVTAPAPPPCSFCEETVDVGPDRVLSCTDAGVLVPGLTTAPGIYEWTLDGEVISDQLSVFAETPGSYVLTATYPGGCVARDSLVIESNTEAPAITAIEIIPERCRGENNGRIVVEEVTGGVSPYAYAIDGSTLNTAGFFTELEPGDYTIVITDANGCATDTLITIEPGPDIKIGEPFVLEIMRGDSGIISIEVNVPEAELRSVEWRPPDQLSCDTCLTTQVTATNSQNYTLEVVHENGCIVSTSVQLLTEEDLEVYIPNVFSPNGDGNNDGFTLFADSRVREIASMDIFDRWGEHVFTAVGISPNQPDAGWDGTHKGRPLNPQVLVYTIVTLLDDGREVVFKGDFTLMR